MDIAKENMIRSICRSLEVLLFFVVSVVGFSVLGKTTSLNTKSKTKSRGTVATRELLLHENSPTQHHDIENTDSCFSSQVHQASPSFSIHPGIPPFPNILHHLQFSLTHSALDKNNNDFFIASSLLKPGNLFQQNPVLLI
ncbi:MAG: hypothetical protein WCI23_06320 [Chlorobiaceae bacterium]|jgi:hypothetical protein